MNHLEAHELFRRTAPEGAGPRAVWLVQAVSWHETNYGQGWARSCPAMVGSNNLGAMQGTPGAICRDRHADGTWYQWSYRFFPSLDAGASAMWAWLWRHPHVKRFLLDDALDPAGMAQAMRRDGYFEATETSYARALSNALKVIR